MSNMEDFKLGRMLDASCEGKKDGDVTTDERQATRDRDYESGGADITIPVISDGVIGLLLAVSGASKGAIHLRSANRETAIGWTPRIFGDTEDHTRAMRPETLDKISPPAILTSVRDYLNKLDMGDDSFEIDTPSMLDTEASLSQSRDKVDVMKRGMAYFLQKTLHTVEMKDGKDWYDHIIAPGLYQGGRILLENMARLFFGEDFASNPNSAYLDATFKLMTRMKKTNRGVFELCKQGVDADYKGVFLELAAGNADISTRLGLAYRRLQPFMHLQNEMSVGTRLNKTIIRSRVINNTQRVMQEIEGYTTEHREKGRIGAVDYAKGFTHYTSSKEGAGLFGIEADLCLPTDKFLKKTELKPNSIDTMTLVLAIDRLEDLDQALTNIRSLARLDGTSKIMISFYLPLNNVADTKSKNPNLKKVPFWSTDTDIRTRWMSGKNQSKLSSEDDYLRNYFGFSDVKFENMTEEELEEAQKLIDIIVTMNLRYGFKAFSMGVQPYEVYSPHNVIEFVGELRRLYDKEELKCGVADIDNMIESIYSDSCPYSDDAIVVIPERINRLYNIAFRIDPLDGTYFEPISS